MPSRPTKTDLTVGFSQVTMNHPFRIANVESMKQAARRAGVGIVVTNAEGSVEREIDNIRRLIARPVDALIVSSLSGPPIHPAYVETVEAGIPLVIFASGVPDDPAVPYTSYVATDEVDMGRRAAEYVAERMGGRGDLAIIEGIRDSTNARLRRKGFMPRIAEVPEVRVVADEPAQWLRRPAQQAMMSILEREPRVDAVFAQNDEMALGAIDALRRAHRDGDVFVVGLDGQKEALQAIRLGGPFAMTIRNEWDGTRALRTAIAAAEGKRVPKRVVLKVPLIDRENVDELFDPNATF